MDVPQFSDEEIEEIIAWNDPARLCLVPLSLSLHHPKLHWAIGKCINLANHADPTVRGNALQSFGHFARRFRTAHRSLVEPLIQEALKEKNKYIRESAMAAADEIDAHCTWKVDRTSKHKKR
ncbi:MAG TPA: hypothetical protein VGC39_01485 [Candidatus Methylacidiphilales bacterium]